METSHEREYGANDHDRDGASVKRDQADRNEAAIAEGTTPERVRAADGGKNKLPENTQSSASPGQVRPGRLQDGYRDTEGREYDLEEPVGELVGEDRDPTHSGARQARHKPGTPANAPGREEGTAWSENKQMSQGQNPKNPSN
jgi:hypothetical protein